MKICVIGTGYVGLVAGTCLAEMGNSVICIDNDKEKLYRLENGIIPIYEPGLEDLIKTNIKKERLKFSNDLNFGVQNSKICFIAVGTPENEDGYPDLTSLFEVAENIARSMNEYKVIVNKSTAPVGTTEKIAETIRKITNFDFDIISNPEFLKQGAAVDDFLRPDRIIIGTNSDKGNAIMKELYSPFVRTGNPIITMDIKSAEMTKYASNAFLATKISFANEIANICEKTGANPESVRIGMSADSRIGNKFLFPGLGYGGSCFPKDVKALINIAEKHNYNSELLKATHNVNQKQRKLFLEKIFQRFGENLSGKTFAIWGLSFKPKTNDMREAPSLTVIENLLQRGAKIKAYDPKAIETAKRIFGDKIEYSSAAYETLDGADTLLLLTEWNEFRLPDFDLIKKSLKNPIIFDGRNQYDHFTLKENGFEYYCTGKINILNYH